MLDIGFFELLVVGVVLIIVMGPERLPEVAKQIAFYIRKARQGMFRLRSEMQSEIQGTPFADLEKAKQEMADLKNDLRQFGREIVESAEQKEGSGDVPIEMTGKPIEDDTDKNASKAD
jgi:sec-independent protein translocase protein TatB